MKVTTFFRKYPNACPEAKEWCKQYDTMNDAWDQCDRPDWMLWALETMDYSDDSKLRKCACRFVREVWELLTDERSRNAVEVAERYADGNATDEELSAARDAASAAAGGAAWAAARTAAWAAARDAVWAAVASVKQADIIREIVGNPFDEYRERSKG